MLSRGCETRLGLVERGEKEMSETSRKDRRRDMVALFKQATDKELANWQVLLSHERTKRAANLFPELASSPIEFLVRNDKYDPSEVMALLPDAYYRGMKARGEMDSAADHLAWLLTDILRIVAYAEPRKVKGFLLGLAETATKANEGSSEVDHFDALAAEILYRYSLLLSSFERNLPGRDFSEHNQVITDDARAIREALEMFKKDGGERLRQNLHRIGTIAKWKMPEDWNKPGRPREKELDRLGELASKYEPKTKNRRQLAERIFERLLRDKYDDVLVGDDKKLYDKLSKYFEQDSTNIKETEVRSLVELVNRELTRYNQVMEMEILTQ
jgi:hypothetical protein